MNSILKFNALHGETVKRAAVEQLLNQAEAERQTEVIKRLTALLNTYPEARNFELEINSPINELNEAELSSLGVPCLGAGQIKALGIEDVKGLAAPVKTEDVYKMVTDKIIKAIEDNGELTWYSGRDAEKGKDKKDYVFLPLPINYSSNKYYRGINAFLLSHYPKVKGVKMEGKKKIIDIELQPITDERLFWLTFKQIKEANGTLKKGSKSMEAVFYNWIFSYKDERISERKYKELERKFCKGKDSSPECGDLKKIPFLRYYNVFNERDIEGIDFEAKRETLKSKVKQIDSDVERIAAAEAVIKHMPKRPPIIKKYIGKGESPAYFPSLDKVHMPLMEQYDDVAIWYGTAFHELIHSTGHESRLSRVGVTEFDHFGSPQYAFEELIAELGSAFLNAETGIFLRTLKKNSAYIKGWKQSVVNMLKADNKAIFKAAGAAQKAADFILDRAKDGTPKFYADIKTEQTPGQETKKDAETPKQKAELQNWGNPETYKDDLDYNQVRNIYYFTSFDPERAAKRDINGWKDYNAYLYNQLIETAKNERVKNSDEKIKLVNELFPKYQKRYLKRKLALIQAGQGMASSAITGGSKFPVAKQNKIHNRYHDAQGELYKYEEWFINKIKGKIWDNEKIISGSKTALEQMKEKLARLEQQHQTELKLRKVKRDKKLTDLEKIQIFMQNRMSKDMAISYLADSYLSPLPNTFWEGFSNSYQSKNIRDLKQRIKGEELRNEHVEKVGDNKFEFDGGHYLYNQEENRLQVFFDDIPEAETRTLLKKNGFRWSRKHTAWQRQLTRAAMNTAARLFPAKKKAVKQPEPKPSENGQLALFGSSKLNISSVDFKNMSVAELRKFTFDYYNLNLKGKTTLIKNHLSEIAFIGGGARKILKPMYKEKAAVIKHLETIINTSTYNNWGARKSNDPANVLGYLNFKSKITIDNVKRHVRISIRVDRDRSTKFKTYEVGAKEKSAKSAGAAVALPKDGQIKPIERNKDTKNKLGMAIVHVPTPAAAPVYKGHTGATPLKNVFVEQESEAVYSATTTEPQAEASKQPEAETPQKNSLVKGLKQTKSVGLTADYFNFTGELSAFLGDLEIKKTHSVVVTLDAPAGSGKTRSLFQMLDMAAAGGYRSIFASLEEHPESKLFTDKVNEYIEPQHEDYIDTIGDLPETYSEFFNIIKDYDVIAVDSWNKVFEEYKGIDFDRDLRKALNGKLIVTIFQRTSSGSMRGGSKAGFDGDVILQVEKAPDFRDSYLVARKNRYQDIPLNEIGYNFYHKKLINPEKLDNENNIVDLPNQMTV